MQRLLRVVGTVLIYLGVPAIPTAAGEDRSALAAEAAPARKTVSVRLLSANDTSALLKRLTQLAEASIYQYMVGHRRQKVGGIEFGEVRDFEDIPNDTVTAKAAKTNTGYAEFLKRHRDAAAGKDTSHSVGLVARFRVIDLVHVPWPADDANVEVFAQFFVWWSVKDGSIAVQVDDAVKGDIVFSTGHLAAVIANKSRVTRSFKIPKGLRDGLASRVKSGSTRIAKAISTTSGGAVSLADVTISNEGELWASFSAPAAYSGPMSFQLPPKVIKLPAKPPRHLGRTTERCDEKLRLSVLSAAGKWVRLPAKKSTDVDVKLKDGDVRWRCGKTDEVTGSPRKTNMVRIRRTGKDRKFYVDWYRR